MCSIIHLICVIFVLMRVVTLASSEPQLVSFSSRDREEDLCSIFPRCQEYGPGTHQVLEDCQLFFECDLQEDGHYNQRNMKCPDTLMFSNKLGRCGEPDEAPECEKFDNLKCKKECPRIYFSSTGLSTPAESLGCFRLKGSKDLNRVAYYENQEKLTLTPYPAMIWVSWHITANTKCPYSGRLVA